MEHKIRIYLAVGLLAGMVWGVTGCGSAAERADTWAEAFCRRDGKALKAMYDQQHLPDFYEIDLVQAQPEDDFVGWGWSSPWPMDGRYAVQTEGAETEITYYAMVSDPHRYVWKEWLTWKKDGQDWYVETERFQAYDAIQSQAEFEEAYGKGIEGTPMDYAGDELGEALNEVASEQRDNPLYEPLFHPGQAMELLLNLQGGSASVTGDGEQTVAVYTFSDKSCAAAQMVQPYGQDGIWVPEKIVAAPEVVSWEQGLLGMAGTAWADSFAGAQAVPFERLADWPGGTGYVSLAETPDGRFQLFGYVGSDTEYRGICIRDWEDNVNSFDIVYTSPQLQPPRMCWDSEQQILTIAFQSLTGAGGSADRLYAFARWDTGHMEAVEFTKEACEGQLYKRLTYEIDKDKNVVRFFDGGEEAASFSLEGLDGSRVKGVVYTDDVRYLAGGQPVLEFMPGFLLDGMAAPQYLETPDAALEADLTVKQTEDGVMFAVGGIRCGNSADKE